MIMVLENYKEGNKHVKDNKIDLFVQKYEEFIIADDKTIDCAFARFDTIITSLKALDESFSSRNHVRKFLRALPTKWRPKVMTIEESKDLSTLPLDELIGKLKVYEVVLEKNLEISRNKKEKYKSLALKARKVLSEEEATSSDSNDEEYAIAQRKIKRRKTIKDVLSVVTQITSLVIVPNTLLMIKRHSLLDVGAIVKMNPRRKKYVSWLLMIMRETMRAEESLNVKFNEISPLKTPPLEDDDVFENENIEIHEKGLEIKENEPLNKEIPNIKEIIDHPLETVI
nr:UBN2 domain-containing protein [Tanacetum cinerariifolium]